MCQTVYSTYSNVAEPRGLCKLSAMNMMDDSESDMEDTGKQDNPKGHFSKKDTESLEAFYRMGLTGWGKYHASNLQQAVTVTGLTESQIIVSSKFSI